MKQNKEKCKHKYVEAKYDLKTFEIPSSRMVCSKCLEEKYKNPQPIAEKWELTNEGREYINKTLEGINKVKPKLAEKWEEFDDFFENFDFSVSEVADLKSFISKTLSAQREEIIKGICAEIVFSEDLRKFLLTLLKP